MTKEQLDPVCGMKVEPDKSLYKFIYQGSEYFFCSAQCLKNFKNHPKNYLHKQLQNKPVETAAEYTCPMHPQIVQDQAGNCPICGMSLEPKMIESGQPDDAEYKSMLFKFWVGTIFSIPVLFFAMSDMLLGFDLFLQPNISPSLQFLLSTPVVLWAGWTFFQRGWQSIVHYKLNMFSLISLGVGVAYIYSTTALFFPHLFPNSLLHKGTIPLYFETAASIIVLALLGQVLELKARGQTSQAIKALLGRAAKTARIFEKGQEREIPIDQVKVGDLLRVRPGDKISVDGTIIEGRSFIDEAMVTGEPIPDEKQEGSAVIGGTINQKGSFLMRAEKVGNETLLSQIIQRVAEAQRSKTLIQNLADEISSYFVPTVVFISILTFIIWALFGPEPSFTYGLVNAVAVLIIACPCALGLATPMSITVGMGRGASMGILIKDAQTLEKLEKVKTLIVDKTGTLTAGKPKIAQIISMEEGKERDILRLAAAIEQNSEHPLANSIIQGAKERSITLPKVLDFQSFTGRGVSGKVEGREVLIGKLSFLEEKKIKSSAALHQKAQELQMKAHTVMCVAVEEEAIGLIAVSDPIKSSTFEAVQELHKRKIKIIMLSGDNTQTAQFVAKELGIDEVYADATPDSKQQFVQKAKGKEGFIAMAGDGINDAPALATADVGIAMGTGTDIAMESASVTLIKGDLRGITQAIRLSHAVMQNIRQNLFFAFVYNALGIPIAAGLLYPFTGLLLNPIIAAFAMSLSSFSVIINSLRLRKIKI